MPHSLSSDRRTAVDEIFDHLRAEIDALRLRPGDRISEAEIAARFGVSRQPVRDAFTRLANLDLLLIRPQRATEVKRFSAREIEKSRFVRAAVEAEVLRRAALAAAETQAAARQALTQELSRQRAALAAGDAHGFSALDYAFHHALCTIAGAAFAFEVIAAEKAKVDRLCLLGLAKQDRMPQLLADHEAIANAILQGDPETAVANGMKHLKRLDSTLEKITKDNASYFENEK
ncbi:GntR family transcriptional regulator [Marinovum algicola]|uniref:GntR family transcriptional regulator n=3 Tax=Marinovum TaxID=367771 RepID=UPI003B525910